MDKTPTKVSNTEQLIFYAVFFKLGPAEYGFSIRSAKKEVLSNKRSVNAFDRKSLYGKRSISQVNYEVF